MNPLLALAGTTALSGFFGSGGTDISRHSTLTSGQQRYLQNMINMNDLYAPQVQGGLFDMAQNPQNAYQELDQNYFGDAVQNPYLRQRESMWDEMESNVAGSGKFHSAALNNQKAKFDEGTSMGLGQLQQQHLFGERGMQMQGAENAMGRSQNAYGMMMQGMYAPLNTRAFENVATEKPSAAQSLFDKTIGSLF